jgi:hypothetical protein
LTPEGKKSWADVKEALEVNEKALWSISEMEKAGHRPDIYDFDDDGFSYGTCSEQTPPQRDFAFFKELKEMALKMGINFMTREEYKVLQSKGEFDTKTYSVLEAVRSNSICLGRRNPEGAGAIFEEDLSDRINMRSRFNKISWRGSLKVRWTY